MTKDSDGRQKDADATTAVNLDANVDECTVTNETGGWTVDGQFVII